MGPPANGSETQGRAGALRPPADAARRPYQGGQASGAGHFLLELKGIVKEFPGVRALDHVDLQVRAGEIHGLVGENGAGKSTLLKILSGVHPRGTYEGEVRVRGEVKQFRNTREAEASGIAIIHQELNLIPELSVAENIFLGHEPTRGGCLDWGAVYRESRRLLGQLGIEVDPRTRIRQLGVGLQQMVEIAKALRLNAQILLLDEPTSALTEKETDVLFRTLFKLREGGVTCIYISHKMDELFAVADRCTVLRDGRTVATADTKDLDEGKIVGLMVGRKIDDMYPARAARKGSAVLAVRDFEVDHPFLPGEKVVAGVAFEVAAGEVLGVAGLMGSGRSELLTALFGAFPSDCRGEVTVAGKPFRCENCREAIAAGLALVTEDRKVYGLVLGMGVGDNVSLASLDRVSRGGVVDRLEERKANLQWVEDLRIKAASLATPVKNLSGGNQQKVVLGKWLATTPKVLLLDEPTRGVDVGARVEIYRIINQLVENGLAVVMVSSSLPEVLKMSDRILVMHQGRQAAILEARSASQELIMKHATGTAEQRP
ncbi:MAG: ATP-binding cassette domain-containing protein [Verrucomicrobiota bacterium]